jgi:hypothetical protein
MLLLSGVVLSLAKFKTDRRGNFVPKNPLTALYLCHAYNVPYATFKRWKAEAGTQIKFVPVNKGKSVILDKKWASCVYNPKRMYVDTQMAIWLGQMSTRKYDTEGKKVGDYVIMSSLQSAPFSTTRNPPL